MKYPGLEPHSLYHQYLRKIVAILILASIFLTSCSVIRMLLPYQPGGVVFTRQDDPEMNAAIQQAKDTLPLFIQALQSPKPTYTQFGIKVAFPYDNGKNIEQMWVNELTFTGDQFTGVLEDKPVFVEDIKRGDRVTINNDDICDWMFLDNNQLIGGFTIYVSRKEMNERDRKTFDSAINFTMGDKPLLP